jgi:hypothetical protein
LLLQQQQLEGVPAQQYAACLQQQQQSSAAAAPQAVQQGLHRLQQQQQAALALAVTPQQLQAVSTVPVALDDSAAEEPAGRLDPIEAAAAASRDSCAMLAPTSGVLQPSSGSGLTSTQLMLQVVQQLQQHSACVAEQLQRLASMWPAAAASATAESADSSTAPPCALPQLQACLQQQQQALELQLLSLEQLVQSAVAAAMLHQDTTQRDSSAALERNSGSLAATGDIAEEQALCCQLLESLSDAVGHLTIQVAAAAPAAANAAAAALTAGAAAAGLVANGTPGLSYNDGAADSCIMQEGRARWIGAVSEVLSTTVQHLLSAMQLVGFEGE